jgi:hypothetical protein
VRVQLRFGSVRLATRTVRAKGGRFRTTFPVGRLRSGRIEVVAKARGTTLRASVLKRGRQASR